jgi:Tfp pilus assembly protein PilF|tara:strand:+ start:1915 stop:2229 length:315 start_codon:yes stop_codon:yes gene_type:complete
MKQFNIYKTLLKKGHDNELLRYSLGNEYFKQGDFKESVIHLEKAIELKPSFSAAWKLYGKALTGNKKNDEAIVAYEKGISIAEKNGDIQILKEMRVFLKRLTKN